MKTNKLLVEAVLVLALIILAVVIFLEFENQLVKTLSIMFLGELAIAMTLFRMYLVYQLE